MNSILFCEKLFSKNNFYSLTLFIVLILIIRKNDIIIINILKNTIKIKMIILKYFRKINHYLKLHIKYILKPLIIYFLLLLFNSSINLLFSVINSFNLFFI